MKLIRAQYIIQKNADYIKYCSMNMIKFESEEKSEVEGYLDIILEGTYDQCYAFFNAFKNEILEYGDESWFKEAFIL